MKFLSYIVVCVVLLAVGCTHDAVIPQKISHDYLFLGHTYQTNNRLDSRLVKMNNSYYEQIWLGGDICAETTADSTTLEFIDQVFDLSNPTTHWTLGNHDVRNGHLEWITEKTGRPTFYTAHFDGITLLVLNSVMATNGYKADEVNAQFNLIKTVCDSISESTHLIVLTHNAVWAPIDPIVAQKANTDGSATLFRMNPNQTYEQAVFPLLEQVQQRGISVVHVAGDFGQKAGTYQYTTATGIQLLGSGITSNTAYNEQFPTANRPDSFLIFHHDFTTHAITWTFEELN